MSLSVVITGNNYSELDHNVGPSSLDLSSDLSETRCLLNTADRSLYLLLYSVTNFISIILMYHYRLSDSSEVISFEVRDSTLHQQRLSTVVEMKTSFKYDIMIIIIVN